MHATTAANLRSAYGGESMAHVRYQMWAEKADEAGYQNVGRLFRAVSFAESVHAGNHFRRIELPGPADYTCTPRAVFGLGTTLQNLQGGIMGETYEIVEMYPAYSDIARFQGERDAEQSFSYALAAEKTHAELFQKAKRALDAGDRDVFLGPMQVCRVCGWTHEGRPPDTCPVCGVAGDKFQAFESAAAGGR